ncbi:hypothetical protein N7486_004228 [Penicillium sp. IBT 16267x]|nr:hypothetical protein N7486_004228 [Penicillium sp. IBT 16267x]
MPVSYFYRSHLHRHSRGSDRFRGDEEVCKLASSRELQSTFDGQQSCGKRDGPDSRKEDMVKDTE